MAIPLVRIAIALFLAGGLAACETTDQAAFDGSYVTDYASCVAAGNPVMESDPRQCLHNGELFVDTAF